MPFSELSHPLHRDLDQTCRRTGNQPWCASQPTMTCRYERNQAGVPGAADHARVAAKMPHFEFRRVSMRSQTTLHDQAAPVQRLMTIAVLRPELDTE